MGGRLWLPGVVAAVILDALGVVAFLAGPVWLAVGIWLLAAVVIVASLRRG